MHYNKLKDYVYEYITDQINKGDIQQGERITEEELCQKMGLSRTPIREAFIELASEGMLIAKPRKGYIVNILTCKRTQDLYEVMGLLEGYIAFTVVDLLTEADYQEMEEAIRQMDEAVENKNAKAVDIANDKFHYCFTRHCINEELVYDADRIRRLFARQSLPFERNPSAYQALVTSNSHHKVILELFKKHKKKEIQDYFQSVHWSKESPIFKVINNLSDCPATKESG